MTLKNKLKKIKRLASKAQEYTLNNAENKTIGDALLVGHKHANSRGAYGPEVDEAIKSLNKLIKDKRNAGSTTAKE